MFGSDGKGRPPSQASHMVTLRLPGEGLRAYRRVGGWEWSGGLAWVTLAGLLEARLEPPKWWRGSECRAAARCRVKVGKKSSVQDTVTGL